MAVMLQGFYWDCAAKENKKGEWWNYLAAEIPMLGKKGSGFDSIWLPPFSKAANRAYKACASGGYYHTLIS
jgi:alpha-amylase